MKRSSVPAAIVLLNSANSTMHDENNLQFWYLARVDLINNSNELTRSGE